MPVKIGFAIISFNEPERILRLVRALNAMFGSPPIACHHDFGQCPFDKSLFPSNVRFAHPHLSTGWCHINTPLSALMAFRTLRESDDPDWFVLLTGSDYPVRRGDQIIEELSNSKYDGYLDYRELLYNTIPPEQTAPNGYGRSEWVALTYDRYRALRFRLPVPFGRSFFSEGFSFHMRDFFVRNPLLLKLILPNSPSRIFAGAFWVTANRKAMKFLLDDPSVEDLVAYFGKRPAPEEGFFHTILCNQPGLNICKDKKRYEDWTRGGSHPKWLEVTDVPNMVASGAHFARKFRGDNVVQDVLDETVLGITVCSHNSRT